jgi:dTDP-4-amino-4,6-dideoxygalactose transaminase
MLKASEAWALTKKYDKYAEQLTEIEEVIKQEAERGESCTWWYCENMTAHERNKLAERLKEFGYVTHAGGGTIYINWRNAKEDYIR